MDEQFLIAEKFLCLTTLFFFSQVMVAPAEDRSGEHRPHYCSDGQEEGSHISPQTRSPAFRELRFVLHKLNYWMFSAEKPEGKPQRSN